MAWLVYHEREVGGQQQSEWVGGIGAWSAEVISEPEEEQFVDPFNYRNNKLNQSKLAKHTPGDDRQRFNIGQEKPVPEQFNDANVLQNLAEDNRWMTEQVRQANENFQRQLAETQKVVDESTQHLQQLQEQMKQNLQTGNIGALKQNESELGRVRSDFWSRILTNVPKELSFSPSAPVEPANNDQRSVNSIETPAQRVLNQRQNKDNAIIIDHLGQFRTPGYTPSSVKTWEEFQAQQGQDAGLAPVKEAAQQFRVSQRQIRRLVADGVVEGQKLVAAVTVEQKMLCVNTFDLGEHFPTQRQLLSNLPETLPVKEAAQRLGITPRQLRRLVADGVVEGQVSPVKLQQGYEMLYVNTSHLDGWFQTQGRPKKLLNQP